MAGTTWVDLLDPDGDEVRRHAPRDLHPRALEQLTQPAGLAAVRPTIEGHGNYVFGVLLAAVAVPTEDRVFYQEIDFVLTKESLLTVRKTPPAEAAFDPAPVRAACDAHRRNGPGMVAYHLLDEVAERYLDLVDDLDDEISELEENVEVWRSVRVHRRLSALRHDLLNIRRTLAPTRDAVHGIVSGRIDIARGPLSRAEVFPEEVELHVGGVHAKLLRASEALEFSRDLLAAVRDYHQARMAHEQNQVIRKLTVVASLVLFPTFIVGVYGQNFEHMPELGWKLGYLFSWGLIAVVTVAQLAFFRWRRWI